MNTYTIGDVPVFVAVGTDGLRHAITLADFVSRNVVAVCGNTGPFHKGAHFCDFRDEGEPICLRCGTVRTADLVTELREKLGL